jgi:hypothetical protein
MTLYPFSFHMCLVSSFENDSFGKALRTISYRISVFDMLLQPWIEGCQCLSFGQHMEEHMFSHFLSFHHNLTLFPFFFCPKSSL